MAKEESKIVEAVEQAAEIETQETPQNESDEKFNPLAFASDKPISEESKEEETTENTEGNTVESTDGSEEKSQEEEGWSWNKDEETTEASKEESYNWEGEEKKEVESNEQTSSEINWSDVSKELGIEGASKEEIINTLNDLAQRPEVDTSNTQVVQLQKFLALNDRDLVGEELKANGMDDAEIEESLDKLEDSGMLKIKAKEVKKVINNAIESHTNTLKKQQQSAAAAQKANAEKAKKELQNTIKDMNEFMGGKVTKKQKEEVYRYATSKMMDDIYSSHANVADVAMFMLYRKQIEKILRTQGLEDGKAAIMNSIVSPNLNTGKSKPNFKVKSGKFDPKAFMTE
jgi:hypothetical protein|tara:strand:+ start:83 stop:1114 length:1032 start_codon:yes stop_codon:yes gene_type:complete